MLLANTPALTESQLHSLEQAARGTGLNVHLYKTQFVCFNQDVAIYPLIGLVSLLNINLCGLSNTKAILLDEQQGYDLTHSWGGVKENYTFPKGYESENKPNNTTDVRIHFFKAAVQPFSHNSMDIHPFHKITSLWNL